MATHGFWFTFACLVLVSGCDGTKKSRNPTDDAGSGNGLAGSSADAGRSGTGTAGVGGNREPGEAGAPSEAGTDSPSGGSAGGPGGDLPQQSCAAFAETACERLEECQSFRFGIDYGDTQRCRVQLQGLCEHFAASERPVDIETCLDALRRRDCHVIIANAGLPSVCRFPRGSLRDGQQCGRDSDCASLVCDKKAACGTCKATGKEGAVCDSADACETGLVCNFGRCAAPVAPGAPCDLASNNRCPAGTFCINQICKPNGKMGEPCDILDPCNEAGGAVCSNSQCAATRVAGNGEPCGSAAENTVCGFGLLCSGPPESPVCALRAGIDESCAANSECTSPLFCNQSKCSYEEASTCN